MGTVLWDWEEGGGWLAGNLLSGDVRRACCEGWICGVGVCVCHGMMGGRWEDTAGDWVSWMAARSVDEKLIWISCVSWGEAWGMDDGGWVCWGMGMGTREGDREGLL